MPTALVTSGSTEGSLMPARPFGLKPLLLLFAFLLLVLAVGRNVTVSAETSTPLMHYGLGNIIPIDQDEDGLLGTTGKTPAVAGAQPWLAALVYKPAGSAARGYFCAGTVIGDKWILTAAHCLEEFKPAEIEVIVGRHDLTTEAGQVVQSAQFYSHAGWQSGGFFDNDIAIIELATPLQGVVALRPITSALGHLAEPGDTSRTVGWGLLQAFDTTIPDVPWGVDFPITTEIACRAGYENEPSIGPKTICAGYITGQASSCSGDSGSALLVTSDDGSVSYQAGIVSGGAGCGWISKYGVYTRMSAFNDWVGRVIDGSWNASDTITTESLMQPPENFLGFTLKSLPFGFEFVDAFVDSEELFLEYAASDGRELVLGAIANEYTSIDELIAAVDADIKPEERFVIDGVDTVIIDYVDFVEAVYIRNGILVYIDAEVTIDQMQAIVSTVLKNSN